MDKLKMAHEYALEMLKETIPTGSLYGSEARSVAESIVKSAFALADMMQAEADERKQYDPMKKVREQEWQPDWSRAPEWANWWSVDENGTANFSGKKPHIEGRQWVYYSAASEKPCHIEAPSFSYQGDWKDSLRKRPSNI